MSLFQSEKCEDDQARNSSQGHLDLSVKARDFDSSTHLKNNFFQIQDLSTKSLQHQLVLPNFSLRNTQRIDDKHYNNIFLQKYQSVLQNQSSSQRQINSFRQKMFSGTSSVKRSNQSTINLSKFSQNQLYSSQILSNRSFNENLNGFSLSIILDLYAAKSNNSSHIQDNNELQFNFVKLIQKRTENRILDFHNLQFNQISAEILSNFLSQNPDFYKLDISTNPIGNEGVSLLIHSLQNNTNLISLNFSNNNIDDTGFNQLFTFLQNNQFIVALNISTQEGYQRNHISLESIKRLSDLLQTNALLQFLDLSGSMIQVKGLKLLCEGLTSNKNSILYLNLSHNQLGFETGNYIFSLFHHSRIIDLDLSGNSLGDSSMLSMQQSLLKVENPRFVIQRLNLCNNSISGNGLEALSNCLQFCSFLEELDLSENNFYSGGIQHLERFLEISSQIRVLNLSSCTITSAFIVAFCNGLGKNQSLKYLNLCNNTLRDQGCIELAKSFKSNRSLQHLNLEKNQINSAGLKELAQSLVDRNVQTTLNLSHNIFKTESVVYLVNLVKSNSSILDINLDKNLVGADMVKKLNRQLRFNKQIEYKGTVPGLQSQLSSFQLNEITLDDIFEQRKTLEVKKGACQQQIEKLSQNKVMINTIIEISDNKQNQIQDNHSAAIKQLQQELSDMDTNYDVFKFAFKKKQQILDSEIDKLQNEIKTIQGDLDKAKSDQLKKKRTFEFKMAGLRLMLDREKEKFKVAEEKMNEKQNAVDAMQSQVQKMQAQAAQALRRQSRRKTIVRSSILKPRLSKMLNQNFTVQEPSQQDKTQNEQATTTIMENVVKKIANLVSQKKNNKEIKKFKLKAIIEQKKLTKNK